MNSRPLREMKPTPMPTVRFTRRGEEISDAPLAPRLLTRKMAAAYLSISTAMLDSLRLQGEVVPVAMPGRNGETIRVPLYDRAMLDHAIDRWTSRGGRG